MKTIKFLSIIFFTSIILSSCSDDNPVVVNEEEVISIINITLVNAADGTDTVSLSWIDTDEDGTVDTVTSDAVFAANSSYTGTITLANQEEAITPEIVAENDEHQFFYSSTNSIATFSYNDKDGNGNPVGLSFTMNTGAAGTGAITAILRHEPIKDGAGVSGGDITNAGGSTDIEVSFNVTVK